MITAKQAADNASRNLMELIPISGKPLIEEVELSSDRAAWLITLSFAPPDIMNLPFQITDRREYKLFTIDSETGDVLSMKIRPPK